MLIQERSELIQLNGFLADHFCDSSITASKVKEAYDCALRILDNPNKFPKANFDYLERLTDELFMLSPIACDLGI